MCKLSLPDSIIDGIVLRSNTYALARTKLEQFVQAELAIHFNSGASFCAQEYQLLRLTKKIFLYVIYLTNLLVIISKDEVPFLSFVFVFKPKVNP